MRVRTLTGLSRPILAPVIIHHWLRHAHSSSQSQKVMLMTSYAHISCCKRHTEAHIMACCSPRSAWKDRRNSSNSLRPLPGFEPTNRKGLGPRVRSNFRAAPAMPERYTSCNKAKRLSTGACVMGSGLHIAPSVAKCRSSQAFRSCSVSRCCHLRAWHRGLSLRKQFSSFLDPLTYVFALLKACPPKT